jgi:membrane dipeptidase
MRFLIDGHLDLGWNALSLNRDLSETVPQIRQRETGMTDQQSRGNATVSLPHMRQGRIAICMPTLLTRSRREDQAFTRENMNYGTPEIAHAAAHGQLAYYRVLEEQGHVRFIADQAALEQHWSGWLHNADDDEPLGFILSMEGADPIVHPGQLEQWWQCGLRVLSLVHYGNGPYAAGTGADGPITPQGYELLKEMNRVGMILDVTHLNDESFDQALDAFAGPIIATHSNCRALASGLRQFTDDQIKRLIERNAVIGAALDIWMLTDDWPDGMFDDQGFWVHRDKDGNLNNPRAVVGLDSVVKHMDHICQLAGNCKHVAIGSDLDGGFGTEQSPRDLDTIEDIHKMDAMLASCGYSSADIDAMFYGNWLGFFRNNLPAAKSPREHGRSSRCH